MGFWAHKNILGLSWLSSALPYTGQEQCGYNQTTPHTVQHSTLITGEHQHDTCFSSAQLRNNYIYSAEISIWIFFRHQAELCKYF